MISYLLGITVTSVAFGVTLCVLTVPVVFKLQNRLTREISLRDGRPRVAELVPLAICTIGVLGLIYVKMPSRSMTTINDGPFHSEILASVLETGHILFRPNGISAEGAMWSMDGLYPVASHLQVVLVNHLIPGGVDVAYNFLSVLYAAIWFPFSLAMAALFVSECKLSALLVSIAIGIAGAPNLDYMQLPGIANTPFALTVSLLLAAQRPKWSNTILVGVAFLSLLAIHPSGVATCIIAVILIRQNTLIRPYALMVAFAVLVQKATESVTSTVGYLEVWTSGNVTATQGFSSSTDIAVRGLSFVSKYLFGLGGDSTITSILLPSALILAFIANKRHHLRIDTENLVFFSAVLVSSGLTGLEHVGSKFGYLTLFWYGDPKRVVLVWSVVVCVFLVRTISSDQFDKRVQA